MAPEQTAATPTLTAAVDVYGLGAILYEVPTGRPPFSAETPLDTPVQVRTREPARPHSINTNGPQTSCAGCRRKLLKRIPFSIHVKMLESVTWNPLDNHLEASQNRRSIHKQAILLGGQIMPIDEVMLVNQLVLSV
jgi:serine/threonine protein kinase